jgi:UDP-N-acetylbacillosamine N-acetyltransferase
MVRPLLPSFSEPRRPKRVSGARTLVIFGAGGHGRVAADCAEAMRAAGRAGWRDVVFLDPQHERLKESGRWPVHGGDDAIADFDPETTDCFIGIGDNELRQRLQQEIAARDYRFAMLIHPTATLGSSVSLGDGTLVMPRAVINFGAVVGDGAIVNTGAIVEHDCRIGAWVHLAPGSVLGGEVTVGDGCPIGLGARVLPGIQICAGTVIGGGATVTKSIAEAGIYGGTPARRLRG